MFSSASILLCPSLLVSMSCRVICYKLDSRRFPNYQGRVQFGPRETVGELVYRVGCHIGERLRIDEVIDNDFIEASGGFLSFRIIYGGHQITCNQLCRAVFVPEPGTSWTDPVVTLLDVPPQDYSL